MSRLAEEVTRYPDLSLDPLDTPRMPERDAALAHAIYDAAVRRWLTISFLCGHHLRQRWDQLEPGVLAALLAGSAQLLFFDRVPVHAAIDESVEWTKLAVNPRAGGLVNAVLRRVGEMVERDGEGNSVRRDAWTNGRDELPMADGSVLVLRGELLPADPIRRASAATGVPAWQIRQWADQHGEDDAPFIAWHTLAPPPTIIHAPAGAPDLPTLEAHESPRHRVFTGSRPELTELLASDPNLWVQDPTAGAALDVLGEQSPELIIDLCAGRGTKTRHLLQRFPRARVIACEISKPRLNDLTALRASFRDRVTVMRPEQAVREAEHRADLVLADVPCSNSGVLARRTEARHRCGERQLARLVDQQREILSTAARLLAPGGTLLYSTCSLEEQENTAALRWAERSLGLTPGRHRLILPAGGPGRPASEHHDGGFAACLAAPAAPA